MAKVNFKIWRGDVDGGDYEDFSTEITEGMVVLDAVHQIQAESANDLAVRWNCKAGKCGSCSAEVNGKPRLMCMTRMSDLPLDDGITIEPMQAFPVLKDLVCDVSWNYRVKQKIQRMQPRPADDADADGQPQALDRLVSCLAFVAGPEKPRDRSRRPVGQEDEDCVGGGQSRHRDGQTAQLRSAQSTDHGGVGQPVKRLGHQRPERGHGQAHDLPVVRPHPKRRESRHRVSGADRVGTVHRPSVTLAVAVAVISVSGPLGGDAGAETAPPAPLRRPFHDLQELSGIRTGE